MEAAQQGAGGTGWAGSAGWGAATNSPDPFQTHFPPRPLTTKLWENERFQQLLWDERRMWHLKNLSSWEPSWHCCSGSGCGGSCISRLGSALGRMRMGGHSTQ